MLLENIMPLKEFRRENPIPVFVRGITESEDPEFRTCEVITKIDHMLCSSKQLPLRYTEKIEMLKSLKRGLERSLKQPFLISSSQHDRNRTIYLMIDDKIREYSLCQQKLPPEPRIYDRR